MNNEISLTHKANAQTNIFCRFELLVILRHAIYNKKYSKGSLYGLGIFPFWLYVKYFGKPVYRLCRKIGLPKYLSFCGAHTLGALFHINFFIIYDLSTSIILLIASYIIFPPLFYFPHVASK